MLQIRNLTIAHRKDLRQMIEGFSMTLQDGDKTALIGEEGNGKSTLLQWIYDPALIAPYAKAEGERVFKNERLGYLPQELVQAEREKTVREYFEQSDGFFRKTPREQSKLAETFGVQMEFFRREQTMGSLSGGERVKAQLLRIMFEEPTVLLLDEPTNDVDLETLELLEQLINGWKHIVLFISHDEVLLERTANSVVHMEQIARKTACRASFERIPYRQYVEKREHLFARQMQQALGEKREKELRDEKYRRILQSVERAQNKISRQDPHGGALLKKKMHTVKALEKRFAREDEERTQKPQQEEAIALRFGEETAIPAGKTVLSYRLDALRAPDGRLLSKEIELVVRGPEKIGIVGANGCGKSTLLKNIKETLRGRTDITAGWMPQNYEELLDLDATPVEFLAPGGEKAERTRVRTRLGSLKYTPEEMEHPIRELSGGQKAKVLLLKLSLSGANVLLLDEPTRNFSPLSAPVIRRMLSAFSGAVLSVSHDRKYLEEVCTQVYRLSAAGLQRVR